jgi:hypothetical protein
MGRPINNIRKAGLRIKINREGYKTIYALTSTVVAAMTGNANFVTPLPTLATITAAGTSLKDAMAFMGQKRNRSSRIKKVDCQAKALAAKSLLDALLNYVIQTALQAAAGDMAAFNTIVTSSGFGLKDVRSINPRAQIATFVRQDNSKLHPGNEGRLNWKRPLGLIKGAKVAGYNILIGGVIVQTTTKTNTIIPTVPGVNTDVVIVPFNSRGQGAPFNATVKGIH